MYQEHQDQAKGMKARCAIATLSDSRTTQTDKSGDRIAELLTGGGHSISDRRLIANDVETLQNLLNDWLGRDDIDVILTTGGTGISSHDLTAGVVEELLDKCLPGFGELFRMLSWQEIGSGAILSRAIAGVARKKLIFALPGSTSAVELGVSRLIVPELGHLLKQLAK
jgi:molybdenum cofactor biosynthesis protein B